MRPLLPDQLFAERAPLFIDDDAAQAGGDSVTPIDLAQAEQRFGGPDRWARLLEIYLEDTADRVQKISDAVAAGDLETIRKEAHSIKGASAQICAEPMRAVSAAAENAARDGQAEAALAHARRIPTEFERFRQHTAG